MSAEGILFPSYHPYIEGLPLSATRVVTNRGYMIPEEEIPYVPVGIKESEKKNR